MPRWKFQSVIQFKVSLYKLLYPLHRGCSIDRSHPKSQNTEWNKLSSTGNHLLDIYNCIANLDICAWNKIFGVYSVSVPKTTKGTRHSVFRNTINRTHLSQLRKMHQLAVIIIPSLSRNWGLVYTEWIYNQWQDAIFVESFINFNS